MAYDHKFKNKQCIFQSCPPMLHWKLHGIAKKNLALELQFMLKYIWNVLFIVNINLSLIFRIPFDASSNSLSNFHIEQSLVTHFSLEFHLCHLDLLKKGEVSQKDHQSILTTICFWLTSIKCKRRASYNNICKSTHQAQTYATYNTRWNNSGKWIKGAGNAFLWDSR